MARLINYFELKQRILEERDKIPKTLPPATYELGIGRPNTHGNSMRGGIRIALRCLEQCQSVTDMVEVVRCKDCKFCREHPTSDKVKLCTNENWNTEYYPFAEDNGFCVYGERRSDV